MLAAQQSGMVPSDWASSPQEAWAMSEPANLADSMPLARLLGIRIDRAAADGVTATMTVSADHGTVGNMLHGGAIMALADSTAAVGAFLALPEGAAGTTTIEAKTNFLGPCASGQTVTAEATPVSIGRRLSVWQTRIRRENGRDVALVTQTQLVL
jgi:uncharacterized protein (TIGR00369 family)